MTELSAALTRLQAALTEVHLAVLEVQSADAVRSLGGEFIVSSSEHLVQDGVPPLQRCCEVCLASPDEPCTYQSGVTIPRARVHFARFGGVPF